MGRHSKKLNVNLSSTLRKDIPASIVVFLVALPLCLGIALASEAPLFAGIVSGVIGGIVVGWFSGSSVSVSGPAAGLTVIVASGIHSLGSYETFICAVFLSGLFQLVFSFLRFGSLASLFPNAVVKGMLSAIGITIILKQLPHVLGNFGAFESDMAFWDLFGTNTTKEMLSHAFSSVSFGAVVICFMSFGILSLWESSISKGLGWIAKLPGPLVVVALATGANLIFQMHFPDLALYAGNGHLVQLPHIHSVQDLLAEIRWPNFSAVNNPLVWKIGLTLAAVGSVETLLSIESTDKLDPYYRVSDTNKELRAQGIGNILSGLMGGLPMTSVIVRSSANIYAGSRTRLSAILHGVILFLSVLVLGHVLNLIPLAALATILLAVGYKLAHPKIFKAMYQCGWDQFLPFTLTIAAILFTDLLKGVGIGLLIGLAFVVKASYYSAILVVREHQRVLFRFTKDVTFIHKMKLRKELALVVPGDRVYFDASRASYIDRDVFEMIHEFARTSQEKGVDVELRDITVRESRRLRETLKENQHGVLQETATRQSSLGEGKERA